MIIIALGSNLPGPWGSPRSTIRRALAQLRKGGCRLVRVSSLMETAPFGKTDQPNFINAAARVETAMKPGALLAYLKEIENLAGRVRGERWGPRPLDLDIIDYHGMLRRRPPPVLPHPEAHRRAFVLGPISEIAPRWRHPILKKTAAKLLQDLEGEAEGRILRKIPEGEGWGAAMLSKHKNALEKLAIPTMPAYQAPLKSHKSNGRRRAPWRASP